MKLLSSLLLILSTASCSSVHKAEYISKVDGSFIFHKITSEKRKIFIQSLSCEDLNCSIAKNQIEKELDGDFIILDNQKDADIILKIYPTLISANVNAEVIEKIKYWTLLNATNQLFYFDNNTPKILNEKSIIDNQNFLNKDNNSIADTTKLTGASIVGAASGYLISHSLFGALTGGIAILPIFYGSRYLSESKGVVAVFEVLISEKLTEPINITVKNVLKTSSNSVEESSTQYKSFYKKDLVKIIIAGNASRFNLTDVQDNIVNILINKIVRLLK